MGKGWRQFLILMGPVLAVLIFLLGMYVANDKAEPPVNAVPTCQQVMKDWWDNYVTWHAHNPTNTEVLVARAQLC